MIRSPSVRSDPIVIRFQLTDRELGQVQRAALLDAKSFPILTVVLVLLSAAMLFVGLQILGIFLLALIAVTAALLLSPLLGKRIRRSSPFVGEVRTWTFGDDAIEVRGERQTSTWSWQDISQFYERSGCLFLRVTGGSQRIQVPLRVFESPSEAARFSEFVREHLGFSDAGAGPHE